VYDIRWIREAPDAFDRGLERRGLPRRSPEVLDLDQRHRAALAELQDLQARRNDASRQVGELKRRGEPADALMAEVAELKDRMGALESRTKAVADDLQTLLAGLPNQLADDVPDGPDESANRQLRAWGEPPTLGFAPKQHFELGEGLGGMDFEAAARLAGARFTLLRGPVARLHRALGQFMLDLHTREHGYTEVVPPYLVRDEVLYGTGQLPKFGEDLFRTTDGRWLIPTAEVPLTNVVADQIVDPAQLPLRLTALTPCFRSEAGAAGRDVRGMLRQHQFDKVELVSIVPPEESDAEQERMTACAEAVLQRLELPYRVMVLCSGDTGFSARRTYDLEVWLPGQGAFREISSCSTCGDFQARRMNARFRPAGEKQTRFLHTLNGSGVAVGRALIAVLENHQQGNGSIRVPAALQPYLGGEETIGV